MSLCNFSISIVLPGLPSIALPSLTIPIPALPLILPFPCPLDLY